LKKQQFCDKLYIKRAKRDTFAQFIYFIISRALLSSVKAKLQTNIFYFSQSNIIALGNLNGHFHERIF
jgi:hypothetical protein